MSKTKTLPLFFAVFVLVFTVIGAVAAEQDLMLVGVQLRPGVFADINLSIFNNPANDDGFSILTVHGVAHTGNTFRNLAEQVFSSPELQGKVSGIIAMDLPGHGDSSLPYPTASLEFGNLTLSDYTAAVLGTLVRLKSMDMQPRIILGHSTGGMLVQLTQQTLLNQGTTLKNAFKVKQAILLASTLPRQLPWSFADSGAAAQVLGSLVVVDPELGAYINVPTLVWLNLFFMNRNGVLASGTPAPAEALAQGYIANESLLAALELVGSGGLSRPAIDGKAFSNNKGTKLSVAAFDQDLFFDPLEQQALYTYLTGDARGHGFQVIAGPDAVHSMYIAQPSGVIPVLCKALGCE